jgi:nicotinamidase-related amidase
MHHISKLCALYSGPQALVSISRPHWSLTAIDKLSIRPNMTALLLMDFQRMVVDSYAIDKEVLLERVKRLAVAARNSGVMVIHVVVGFQLGYPEICGRNSISTLRHAADMDYRAVVVADGCSDKDPEVQRILMEKIFPDQARVATVEECIGAIP